MSTPWTWTKRKYEAAWLYAEGKLTNSEICQATRVAERTFYRMIKNEDFKEQVSNNLKKIEGSIAANDIRIRNIVGEKLIERLTQYDSALLLPLPEIVKLFLGCRKQAAELELKGKVNYVNSNAEIGELKDDELDSQIREVEAYLAGYTNGQTAATAIEAREGEEAC